MRIDIIVDMICPWCFIGLNRFERALSARPKYGFDLGIRPFQLNPAIPPSGRERGEYMREKFGSARRAEGQNEAVTRAGRSEGISFRFDRIKRTPNTIDAHRLVLAAGHAGLQIPVARSLFQAYFTEGRDLSDPATLVDIAAEAGLDRQLAWNSLEDRTYRDQVIAEDELARRLGVNGVPCYIIDRRYAVSGAQPPEIFLQVFDLARQDSVDVAAE